jgi:hypothetical protein
MAQSLETLRSNIMTSLFGRRLGMDKDECLVGQKAIKLAVTDLTSASTATAIPNYGAVNIMATTLATSAAGGAFVLSNPIPGVSVRIANGPTQATSAGSSAIQLVRPSTGVYIQSSDGSTMTTVNLGVGGYVELLGLSSGVYSVVGRNSLAGTMLNGTT